MSEIKADELVAGQRLDIHLANLGQRYGGARSAPACRCERDAVVCRMRYGEGDEAEIDGVVQDVLVDQVGAAVFDPHVNERRIHADFLI